MKLLLSGDWQTEFSNLDLCGQAFQELVQCADAEKPDAIVFTGDLKEAYNPIDARVIKFWVRAIRILKKRQFRVFILKGNHDRISQAADSKDWLDILRAAGAETFSKPGLVNVADGFGIAFLPYTADKQLEKQWAASFALEKFHPWKRVLIFHTEVRGCSMGHGVTGKGISLEELTAGNAYAACFGGHIHEYQKLSDSVCYVGSPFCQDWGEANQRKGFVLYDSNKKQWKRIYTTIPCWYDADYLKKNKITPEAGAYIRSKVKVSTKKITDTLREEEKRLTALYGTGVKLFVKPDMKQAEQDEVQLKTTNSDKTNVESYLAATMPDAARFKAREAVSYLSSVLSQCSYQRATHKLRLISATGRNVLSFQKVKFKYARQGVVLIRGENKSWPKQSNGAGKTNLLSLLPIAWSGQTLKKQKADEWATENCDERSVVRLLMYAGKNKRCVIERARPHELSLIVDGQNQSSGLTGREKSGTQGQIEALTGYDYNMLVNAVYIDRSISNGYIFSGDAARMELLGKLQNLERFETAQEIVSTDIKRNAKQLTELDFLGTRLQEEIESLEAELNSLGEQNVVEWQKFLKEHTLLLHDLVKRKTALDGAVGYYNERQVELDALTNEILDLKQIISEGWGSINFWKKQQAVSEKLIAAGKCAVCEQPSIAAGEQMGRTALVKGNALKKKQYKYQQILAGKEKRASVITKELNKYQSNCMRIETEIESAREVLERTQRAADEEQAHNKKLALAVQVRTKKLIKAKRCLRGVESRNRDLSVDREMYEYAKKAFSKYGMPLYLCAGMCPVLNKAADEYSELFFHGKTCVRFSIVDGNFVPQIVNPSGSATVKGQSVGEAACAGIIAAFALRECAPKINILIMDEPGHGLDDEGARQFANGLLKLKDRFESIFITTHHPAIASVLSGEKVWTVQKQGKVSRLIT